MEVTQINPDNHSLYRSALTEKSPEKKLGILDKIISMVDEKGNLVNLKEEAIIVYTKVLLEMNDINGIESILVKLEPFFNNIAKSKTSKIVKNILTTLAESSSSVELQLAFCDKSAEWCADKNRNFLLQKILLRKAQIHLVLKNYEKALELAKKLAEEARAVDDKMALVEAALLVCKINSLLGNLIEAKSSLVIVRTAATSIYCPPPLQAELDLAAGTVALSENDLRSAYSYFYESFDGFDGINRRSEAMQPLKYMLLTKMLSDRPDEIQKLLKSKSALDYKCEESELILKLAEAYSKRSFIEFALVREASKAKLEEDPIVAQNIENVAQKLAERSILHEISPYSRVQLAFIADKLQMSLEDFEKIISKMILEEKVDAAIDKIAGHVTVHRSYPLNESCKKALQIIEELDKSVQKLNQRAEKIVSAQ